MSFGYRVLVCAILIQTYLDLKNKGPEKGRNFQMRQEALAFLKHVHLPANNECARRSDTLSPKIDTFHDDGVIFAADAESRPAKIVPAARAGRSSTTNPLFLLHTAFLLCGFGYFPPF